MMLELGLHGIKIGSDDFDHLRNMRRYAPQTGLPLVISKGMANLEEQVDVLSEVCPVATGGLAVLHCVSPLSIDAHHLNLRQIQTLVKNIQALSGGSRITHPAPLHRPSLSVWCRNYRVEALYSRSRLARPGSLVFLDPRELKEMVANIRFAEAALGWQGRA